MGNIIVQFFINNKPHSNRYLYAVPRVDEYVSVEEGITRKVYCVDWELKDPSNPYIRVWLGKKIGEDI